jgi:hypothetical protein
MLALATTALSCIVTNVHMTGAVGPVMVVQRIYAWIVYTMVGPSYQLLRGVHDSLLYRMPQCNGLRPVR